MANVKEKEVEELEDVEKTNELQDVFLTTFDNPFNPFTRFKEWLSFDLQKGYNCCGKVARISGNIREMSERKQLQIVNESINEIIRLDPTSNYRKVFKDSEFKVN